jgi:hypothetical protein
MGCTASSHSATQQPSVPPTLPPKSPPRPSSPTITEQNGNGIDRNQPITTADDHEAQMITVAPPRALNRDDFGEFTYVQCGGGMTSFLYFPYLTSSPTSWESLSCPKKIRWEKICYEILWLHFQKANLRRDREGD